ncbi:Dicer-like protein 1 [Entomophthora muscae]|uniref:Dicer-like protein 1 n=1 Tax=Entomophthora muscae TaxID=34485 RepID=A0ACC2SJ74_9FUNG|nr:Dicer-like protein 1 [Entomophthora muscae]
MVLVDQARENNLIVQVESEATKSSLAALMIKDTLVRLAQLRVEGTRFSNTVIPFLINSTAQARIKSLEILEVYACRIGMFLKMKDLKKERRGEDILKSHDVIFMEATTLIRLFEESLITMDEIPLIIFDNCRSTKSTHPYYHFLQEFYHKIPDESYRPKLLGLTSLPLVDSLDKISINKLKSMFAAELHIVSISERPWYKESILRYSSAEKYSPTPLMRWVAQRNS